MEGKKLYYSPEEWFEAVKRKEGAHIHLTEMKLEKQDGKHIVVYAKGRITVLVEDAFIEHQEITLQCMWRHDGMCFDKGGIKIEPRGDLNFNN